MLTTPPNTDVAAWVEIPGGLSKHGALVVSTIVCDITGASTGDVIIAARDFSTSSISCLLGCASGI